jgi:hypothetical protein
LEGKFGLAIVSPTRAGFYVVRLESAGRTASLKITKTP